ncbi:MAG TPA: histidine kinase N-terminal domain-containing protein [Mycobacteriales bacterium]|jgi:two-component sensor histidine kinase|nr:histidine kinase N-terminal domain-containing protein [Mycobacteriales bacterium]
MDELLGPHGLELDDADILHRLVGDWQLLADLSFADLVLFVPDRDGEWFTVVAQMRPTTGPTSYQDDLVGTVVAAADRPQLRAAFADGRIVREGDPVWLGGVPVREEALPVTRGGRVLAVIARDTNLAAARTPSRLEIAYLQSANDLAQMLAEGRWPYPGERARDEGSGPRVGDGLIRLDPAGHVTFASPNALSAYRRLGHPGDLTGASLSEVTSGLAGRLATPVDEPVSVLARGRVPRSGDVEGADTIIALRALPLWPGGEHIGALVLVRDVTEVRRRDRQLLSKDATIREIHHRVKNNLQTVAALLRLQARRMDVPQARIALEESVRRVSSIAVVHETLSGSLEESVPFDEVADRVLAMIADVAGSAVAVRRRGSFGVLTAEMATPLAMVLTELVQNAVEHGYDDQQGGTVEIRVDRGEGDRLRVEVVDDGRGLPADFEADASERLGLQIVRTLVGTELGGRLDLRSPETGGTVVTLTFGAPNPGR